MQIKNKQKVIAEILHKKALKVKIQAKNYSVFCLSEQRNLFEGVTYSSPDII